MECIEQEIVGTPTNNGISTITISRSGDLVQEMFIEAQINNKTDFDRNTVYPMERILEYCELSIGGQPIEKHYQRWWRLFSELYRNDAKKTLYSKLVNSENDSQTGYLPLLFFFNRHPGLALPLIALQYHEIKLEIKWIGGAVAAKGLKCWANYIFLDAKERSLFAKNSHEYLIEQVQFAERRQITGILPTTQNVRLNIHHPVKDLIWCFEQYDGDHEWDLWNTTDKEVQMCLVI